MKETEGFRAYFDPVPAAVLMLRQDGGWHAGYRNAAAEKLLLDGEDEFVARIGQEISAGAAVWRGAFRGRELSARMAPYPDGWTAVVFRDATEDLRREQERIETANAALKSALDAANAANRAKTDFLSNMSHDIRTPLNAIIGMITIAKAHLDERERVEDCLEKIGLSSQHLLEIINDILDMSRIESGKITLSNEPFAMADFLHALMAVFRPQAERKRQKIELDFTGVRHETVRGDELRIRQVLLNILSNAVKFTPEEGTISLSVRETGNAGNAEHNYIYYEFTVQDNGIGMNAEFLEKIFLPFERDKNAGRIEGTGLGMAITHNFVKMMNGEITVESEEGRGTKFTVTLPLEQEKDGSGGFDALHGLTVLAAEPDSASLENLKEILGDLGMQCDTVADGMEASDKAAEAHMAGRDYFAILLGWRLPVVDGVQTCREIRSMLGNSTPIFLMSTYEWTLSAEEMKKAGITAFIPKPLFRSRLGETLFAYTPEGRAAREREAAQESESFEGFRILLVEDNEINREIGVELIGMLGAEVECAENGAEAVEMFQNAPPGRYDLIFMDIQMPVMDGLAATRAIRALPGEESRRIPIIAMSANAFVEDIRNCRLAGMNGHVPKPVSLQSLSDAMTQFLKNGTGADGREGDA